LRAQIGKSEHFTYFHVLWDSISPIQWDKYRNRKTLNHRAIWKFSFTDDISPSGQQHGAIHVIPPREWRACGNENYNWDDVFLRCHGLQHFAGDSGVYELTVDHQDGIYFPAFQNVAGSSLPESSAAPDVDAAPAIEREFWRTLGA
jgi:hypothetical protein